MEKEITWLSHGGPGSGRYPKGSGERPRGEIKRLNRLSKRDARLNYRLVSRQTVADTYHDAAKSAHARFDNAKGYFEKRKIRKQVSNALKNQVKWDTKVSEIKDLRIENSLKMQNIKKYINEILNTPLRTVKKTTIVSLKGNPFTTDKYTKYKIDKKALKNK